MAAEIPELLYIGKRFGDSDVGCPFFHRDESDCLVSGAFHEELYLRMLVRRAKGGKRCRSNRGSVTTLFTKALRPQLHEPRGDIAERIRVRHEHHESLLEPGICQPLKHCVNTGGILYQLRALASFRHLSRSR